VDLGQRNTKIVLTQYGTTVGPHGGSTKSALTSINVWASVSERNGAKSTGNQAQDWVYDVKFNFRYQPNFKSDWVITYKSVQYAIKQIVPDRQVKPTSLTAYCTAITT
jgi:SPP1 family predicted phage head-tail adaptor